MIPNRNVLWSTVVAQELTRAGVREVCVAPGSRSAPLALAFHAQAGLRLTTHLDERSAGYFALGIGRATGTPAAVLTTSGTAVANLVPAAVEAFQSRVPLLAFSADRPPELQEVGANQSIPQAGILGRFARWSADVGLPEPTPVRVRHLRSLVCRAVATARGPPAGPVHLNFPFREPLEPRHVPGDVPGDWAREDAEAAVGRPHDRPYLHVSSPVLRPEPSALDELARRIQAHRRGLIVCGPRHVENDFPAAVVELSERSGYPILADPLSGVRFGQPREVGVVSGYDAFLAHAPLRARLRPDVILEFGAAPTSRSLLDLLAQSAEAYHVLVDEGGRPVAEASRVALTIQADAAATARDAAQRLPPRSTPSPWREDLERIEDATWSVLTAELQAGRFEGAAAAAVVDALAPGSLLYVSNSLPIRDVDRFARAGPKPLRVLGNRGASGIDGVLSSALGAAHALRRRATLLIGDLALLHDLNALLTAERLGIALNVVVINNDGGGVFEFLPIAAHDPPFTELFVAPHGADLGALAGALGVRHERIESMAQLRPALERAGTSGGLALLEVPSDRQENVRSRRAVEAALGAALERLSLETVHAG